VFLAELWRYPVKSMGGERLDEAVLDAGGVPGDRALLVEDEDGRLVTSRSRPRLLLHHGAIGPDRQVRVDGRHWATPEVARDVEAAAGKGARLVREEGLQRFDVLPLLVATDGAIATQGVDRRRFRPNLLLGGVPGLTERGWEGKVLAIGEARIQLVSLRQRCIMVTFDPDDARQDKDVLLRIHRELGGTLALDAEVIRAGRVRVGDVAKIL
jgi:uncharacterized protein YcbX